MTKNETMPIIDIIIYIGLFIALYFGALISITLFENRNRLYKKQGVFNFPLVSVLLPCYNEEKEIEEAVASIANLDYPKNKLEIIVIDDGSTDATLARAKILQAKDPRIKVISKPNGGKHTALNLAIPQAKGELIATLDADCRPAKNALKEIIKYLQEPDVWAVTASIKILKPQNILEDVQYAELLVSAFLRKIYSFLGAINVTPGPLTVFKKQVFSIVGLYKKAHLTEDCEMALRMQSKHLKIAHTLDAVVYTKGQKNIKALFRQRIRWYRGFTLNLKDYLPLFNIKQHGNLAVLLFYSFLGPLLSISLATVSAYKIARFSARHISNGWLIRFDFSPFLNFRHLSLVSFNPKPLLFLSIIVLLIIFCYMMLGKWLTFDKTKIKQNIIFYFLFYSFLNASWWFLTGLSIISGKEIKWK